MPKNLLDSMVHPAPPRKVSMQARRLTATLFAATLLAAGCSASTDETATLPPAPPVDETIDTAAAFPDDGLTRFVITPIAGDAPAAPCWWVWRRPSALSSCC